MDDKIEAVDRISSLPEFVLNHILSFLHIKDAARTCVLSKRWNCIWCSFPRLEFDQTTCIKDELDSNPEYMEQVREFMINVVDKSVLRLIQNNLKIESFSLTMPVADPNLIWLVDRWMELIVLGR
ncbi:F-box domain containing protein [Trema orientale]|uniref:F-box domain containing protein n=1 Tax=Trema orientale TaxID=63057 RepID=A0A2P5EFG5_TREOI|nr:F-box domain containing protein [Trema orientale]